MNVIFAERRAEQLSLSLSSDIPGDGIVGQQMQSMDTHGDALRMDSRQSFTPVTHQRAQLRQFVLDQIDRVAQNQPRSRKDSKVSESRISAIANRMAEGVGLVSTVNSVYNKHLRSDAYFYPGQLIDRSGDIVRVSPRRRAVSETITVRPFSPSRQLIEVRGVKHMGTATLWVPGMSQIPQADYYVAARKVQAHHIVCKTQIPWDLMLYGSEADLDIASEKAEAATELLNDAMETILVNGYPGTDLVGLKDISAPTYVSSLDYSNPALTLDQIFRDFMTFMLQIDAANDDRGGIGNTLLIGSQLARRVLPKSNFDVGGDSTGIDIFGKLVQREEGLGRLFENIGISRVIIAPSLNNWNGDTTLSAAIVFNTPAGSSGLRQLIGQTPAPVRSASNLVSDETLWAFTMAGIENASTESVGRFVAKVN